MILTVTANSALDRVIFFDRFVPGTVMRNAHMVECVGGKGFDSSVVLRAFSVDTIALGIMAGEAGKLLEGHLLRYGIRPDLVWADGETRIAHVLAETELHRHSHVIVGGYTVSKEDAADFIQRYCDHLGESQYIIISGSVPASLSSDFYRLLVEEAHRQNVPVLVDCPGQPALAALKAQPTIVKMNDAEFAQTFGQTADSFEQLVTEAREVKAQYEIETMVLTCGRKGILALTEQGDFLASAPEQKAVNAAGAGDAVSSMLAWRLSEGDDWIQSLRWAAAASAAVVLTEGTADCNRIDAERIFPDVEVKTL